MKKLMSFLLVIIFICPILQSNIVKAEDNSNILVAYFSCTGTTEGIAEHISNILGADTYKIEAAQPYTDEDLNYGDSSTRATQEQRDPSARPKISGSIPNIDKYDAVFIGYPIWWGQAPKIIYTFFESYDFSGKKIIPFCTSGSSGIGSSATNLHNLTNGAEWLEGRRFSGSTSESEIKAWTDTIELPEPAEKPNTEITVENNIITVNNAPNDSTLVAAFYKNKVLQDVSIKNGSGTITADLNEDFSENANKADEFKAFVWNMTTLEPLCKTYTLNLNKTIKLSWNENEVSIKLNDSSASKDLLSRLPMTVSFKDYNNTEKISYLDKELNNTDGQEGYEPKAGDFALYTPWGNLSLFYKDFSYSNGLTPLGSVISGSELIEKMEGTIKIELDTTPISPISDNTVLVKGGTFEMGSLESEPERGADEIRHKVTVNDFYISAKEVTQKEYQEITGSNPSENKGDNLPVENVTWYAAVKYCNALSKAKGLTECYTIDDNKVVWNKNANGYRLPTEAEWEYAARANTSTPFSFGDYVKDENANCYNAYGYNNNASGSWVNGYLEHTVNVDSYDANDYGLYNMHGNVAEWVWDWYGDYNTNDTDNPVGSESGDYKIARGGAWNDFPKHIRSAYRSAVPADMTSYGIGIRLVRSRVKTSDTVTSVNKTKNENSAKKVLIAYFSQTGNTEGLTDIIAEMTGADVFRIERKTPYSSTHNSQGLYAEALNEQRENAVPELNEYLEDKGIDISQYDTILLGYCNWWASIPAPVRSFLTHYDLEGKNIIPYCSMGGGRFGQTISAVAKLSPNSVIKSGLDITYSSYDREQISKWLTDNGISVVN